MASPTVSQIPQDLGVKSQAIDIAEIILSRTRRPNTVQTLFRNRISWFEQLSTSEAPWFTTKSDGMWEIQPDAVADGLSWEAGMLVAMGG
jgi:hypothetical protein